MKVVFKQMETEVDQCSLDKKYFRIEKKEFLIENDRLLEQILSQDIVCIAMHSHDDNDNYASMEKSYVEAYNQCLELEAELVKKKDIIEQDVFIELSKSYSKLEKHCISLEIVVQQSKESFHNDKSCDNQDAHEFCEFFEINKLKTQLQAKNTIISNLKTHIQELKGKSVSDYTKSMNTSIVIALGMFKLDLQPLSLKL
ncbi:hypothetical protein Tco_1013218 [Tanacetum coccineum]